MNKLIYPVLAALTLISCEEELNGLLSRKTPNPSQQSTVIKKARCKHWYLVPVDVLGAPPNGQNEGYTVCPDGISANAGDEQLIRAIAPLYPQGPAVNDGLGFTGPEGEFIRYVYYGEEDGWKVTERIIPLSMVLAHPDIYEFLNVQSPTDGQVIFGIDDLYFTYEAEWEQWRGLKN